MAVSDAIGPLARLPLDTDLVARLRATYERVRTYDVRLATIFYAKLFAAAPHFRSMFRGDPEAQQQKLIDALDAVVVNLEQPTQNAAMLAALGARHAQYGARPEHYDLVIRLLIESMEMLLGADGTAADLEEWRMALRLVSNQMIAAAEHPAPWTSGTPSRPEA